MDERDDLVESMEELPESGAEERGEEVVREVPAEFESSLPEAVVVAKPPPEVIPMTNLNTATAEELGRLPGIGKRLARRIVKYRTEVRPFREPAEVMAVSGISEGIYNAIADRLTVGQAEEAEIGVEVGEAVKLGPEPAVAGVEELPSLELEPEGLGSWQVPAPEPELETIAVEEVPLLERKPRPARPAPPPRQGVGWGSLLFVGLLCTLLGAVLALAVLFFLNNGTLDFQAAPRAVRSEVQRLDGQIGTLGGALAGLQGRLLAMEDLASKVEQAQGDIQAVSRSLATMEADLEAMRAELSAWSGNVTALDGRLSTLEMGTTQLDSRVNTLEQQLAAMGEEFAVLRQTVRRFDAFLTGLRALLDETEGSPARRQAPTPTPWLTPTPGPNVTVIPLATPTP